MTKECATEVGGKVLQGEIKSGKDRMGGDTEENE